MRERKKINYAAFGDGDEEDDDFADPTPPNKKKSLSSNKENKKTKDRKKEEDKTAKTERKKTERLSLEEKLYERQLQEALNLSLSESQDSNECETVNIVEVELNQAPVSVEKVPTSVETEDEDKPPQEPVEVRITGAVADPNIIPENQATAPRTKRPVESGGDEIQVLETDISTDQQPAKRRRVTPNKKSKYVDSDSEGSEFQGDSDSDDDFDDEDGDDSDFDAEIESEKKSKTKAAPAGKKQPPPAKTVKTKPASKETKPSVKSRPAATTKATPVARKSFSSPVSTGTSARGGATRGLTGRKTAWTPPAAASSCKSSVGGSSLTSPSSGIRLGLSRNQRVKPLHPSLSVQH